MTNEQIEQTAEAYKAVLRKDGVTIQFQTATGWVDYRDIDQIEWEMAIPRRIKPAPKQIPLTQSDIPLDRPVWIKFSEDAYLLVRGVTRRGLCYEKTNQREYMSFEDLMDYEPSPEITFDGGKTWVGCWKKASE